MRIDSEEVFGPVEGVIRANNDDEAPWPTTPGSAEPPAFVSSMRVQALEIIEWE